MAATGDSSEVRTPGPQSRDLTTLRQLADKLDARGRDAAAATIRVFLDAVDRADEAAFWAHPDVREVDAAVSVWYPTD